MANTGEPVNFKAVARRAEVSRQYLYANFKAQIGELRGALIARPKRAPSVDMALRNTLTETRKEVAELRRRVERALGEAEHWREKCRQLAAENAELSSKLGRHR